jgi:TATA-binding protein-associated factor Taf7
MVIWVALAAVFFRSCYAHQVKKSVTPPSPLELAMTTPHHRPPPAPRVKIEIRDYKIESIDKYRFKVTFRVVNAGTMAANSVRFTLHPWVGGGLVPDKGLDIDPNDPILKKGKDQYIGRMEPGASVTYVMEFFEADGYYPGLAYGDHDTNLQKFDFLYTEAP